jgi:hypothetical protein
MSHASPSPAPGASHHAAKQKVVTPQAVTKSSIVKKIVVIGILFLFLVTLTIVWMTSHASSDNNDKDKKSSSNPPEVIFSGKTYNLLNISYGEVLTLVLAKGETAKVMLTNDYCPLWSSSAIDTDDSNGIHRTLEGIYFIQGPITSSDVYYRTFQNNTQNSITVKIGRCFSQSDCSINF